MYHIVMLYPTDIYKDDVPIKKFFVVLNVGSRTQDLEHASHALHFLKCKLNLLFFVLFFELFSASDICLGTGFNNNSSMITILVVSSHLALHMCLVLSYALGKLI